MSGRPSFGVFELDVDAQTLLKEGRPVGLQPQPCKVLALLVARAGELVTRDEIKAHIWGESTYVDFERGLNYCIAQIRTALGDSAETPRYVQTLPKRGYRFIAPVGSGRGTPDPVPAPSPAASVDERPGSDRRPGHVWRLAGAGLLVVLLGGATWRFAAPTAPPPARIILAAMPFIDLTAASASEPFIIGLTEETVTRLSRVDPVRLGVIGNAPVLRLGGAEKDIPRIGRELGATFVVLGRVRVEADRARATVHLIRVSDFTHLWTGSYDRAISGGLEAQAAIAADVADRVGRALLAGGTSGGS